MNHRISVILLSAFLCALGGFQESRAATCLEILAAADLVEAGDFIHSVWQTSNSYRTRYKPMKAPSGLAITDIDAYILERDIPALYRGYYRRNSDGSFSEDIKQIPNQWLAPNNSTENSLGAQSYLHHLRRLVHSSPSNEEEATSQIQAALRNIHRDWYERNSSWTIPFGEPKTYDEAGIEQRYNGAVQFHRMAEKFQLLEEPLWKIAFNKITSLLVEEKFAPFSHYSVGDAYLAITQKTGARPAITGDPEMAAFFKARIPLYDFTMPDPSHRANESSAVKRFLENHKPELAKDAKILAPPIPPGSPARIYLIQNQGQLVAVIKIQAGLSGLDEIVATVASEKTILATPTFLPVHVWSVGQFANDDFFLIQEAAKSHEADQSFNLSLSEALATVEKIAFSAAQLHGPFRFYGVDDIKKVGSDLTTFRGNCYYDLRQTESFLKTDVLKEGPLKDRIQTNAHAYAEIVEKEPHILSPAIVHGDFHGGNLFVTENRDTTMLIDYAGASWFIGKEIGTGDRGNDLGRMLGAILVEGTRHKLDWFTRILPLLNRLFSQYLLRVGVSPGSNQEHALKISAQFYLNRFLSVNLSDTVGKKLKPLEGESQQNLLNRLYLNWQNAADF